MWGSSLVNLFSRKRFNPEKEAKAFQKKIKTFKRKKVWIFWFRTPASGEPFTDFLVPKASMEKFKVQKKSVT